MNRQQHLLIKLAEECNEVGKASNKAALFGLDDGYPHTTRTNISDLHHELNDLFAIVEMLYPYIEWKINPEEVIIKKAKVEKWMKYAQKKGTMDESSL